MELAVFQLTLKQEQVTSEQVFVLRRDIFLCFQPKNSTIYDTGSLCRCMNWVNVLSVEIIQPADHCRQQPPNLFLMGVMEENIFTN